MRVKVKEFLRGFFGGIFWAKFVNSFGFANIQGKRSPISCYLRRNRLSICDFLTFDLFKTGGFARGSLGDFRSATRLLSLFVFGVTTSTFATLVDFDLRNNVAIYSVLDNQSSGAVTNGGIIATLTASEGTLNRTVDGFGINGPGTDDTDALNSNQWIDVVFNQSVIFSNLNVSSWNVGTDVGDVQLGDLFVSQGGVTGTGDTAYNFSVEAGQIVRLLAVNTEATNGFSVDSFTVAIPEPSVLAFWGMTGLGFVAVRRFIAM